MTARSGYAQGPPFRGAADVVHSRGTSLRQALEGGHGRGKFEGWRASHLNALPGRQGEAHGEAVTVITQPPLWQVAPRAPALNPDRWWEAERFIGVVGIGARDQFHPCRIGALVFQRDGEVTGVLAIHAQRKGERLARSKALDLLGARAFKIRGQEHPHARFLPKLYY